MGILSQQSIITHQDTLKDSPSGRFVYPLRTLWRKNLGFHHNWDVRGRYVEYPGERYNPPGLEAFNGLARQGSYRGPMGRFMSGGSNPDQYGSGFSRLPNLLPGDATSPSLLTSWAWYLSGYAERHGPFRGRSHNSDRMINTFTKKSNTRSLRDKGLGSNRGQTPVASGGPTSINCE